MFRMLKLSLVMAFTLMLFSCDKFDHVSVIDRSIQALPEFPLTLVDKQNPAKENLSKQNSPIDTETSLPAQAFKTVEWTDLMPASDLEALLNPPDYLDDVEDGSFEDLLSNQVSNAIAAANDDQYQQALKSTTIIAEMNNQPIRIPGFIVPLEFDKKNKVTQFFLVPYFGACIHMPPPPPNQIIFVTTKGMELDDIYNPFWITGVLKTAIIENELGTAAYTMQMQSIEMYLEE